MDRVVYPVSFSKALPAGETARERVLKRRHRLLESVYRRRSSLEQHLVLGFAEIPSLRQATAVGPTRLCGQGVIAASLRGTLQSPPSIPPPPYALSRPLALADVPYLLSNGRVLERLAGTVATQAAECLNDTPRQNSRSLRHREAIGCKFRANLAATALGRPKVGNLFLGRAHSQRQWVPRTLKTSHHYERMQVGSNHIYIYIC